MREVNGVAWRGGGWSSRTFTGDARTIAKLASQISELDVSEEVAALAQRIERTARSLEHDLEASQ